MPGPPPEQTTKRRGRGSQRERPGGQLVRKLAGFFVVAGHFQQALGVTYVRAMLGQFCRGHFRGFLFFQPSDARLRRLVRFDARRAEHYDGVRDALALELHEWVDVFAQDAERPRRYAFQEFWIFVRRFRCVLRFKFLAVGHGSSLHFS